MQYLVVIGGVLLALYAFFKLFRPVTIFEFERALKYKNGKLSGVLGPGKHWLFAYNTTVTRVDMRPRFITVPGQEVLSSDSISLKVSIAAQYKVADPALALHETASYHEALYTVLQVALREIIGSAKIDELLEKRAALSDKLLELAAPKAKAFGVELMSASIKDIMFPGELKKIFAQVVKAQKEGVAALERARGETAALRNLANAARLLEANPALMQVRVLQSLGDSAGNTIVLGMPTGYTPLPVKAKEVGEAPTPELPTQETEQ
ncbi:MAG TPA: slipin family protein [Candidatus Obscuribacterales bacterium]